MTAGAVLVVADTLRTHVPAGGKTDYLTDVVLVKCKACQEWIPDSGEHYGGFEAHVAAAVVDALLKDDPDACKHCGEQIRPNQTGGWYHIETPEHVAHQRCFTYATPRVREPAEEGL